MKTKRRFFFHYNKPLSKQKGYVIWSVHFKDTCYYVKEIKCKVPCESKVNKRQLYAVMIGFANNVAVIKNTAIIT